MKKFIKELIPYLIIILVVTTVRTYIITPIKVNGSSMKPTLNGNEIMILNKLNKDEIKRYDVVIVDIGKEDIIKRVIALPGETISCEDGYIFINGRKSEEKYSMGKTDDFKTVKLSKDEYFVLGDNRANSLDSEELGPMKKSQIKGKTNFIIFPFNKMGKLEK